MWWPPISQRQLPSPSHVPDFSAVGAVFPFLPPPPFSHLMLVVMVWFVGLFFQGREMNMEKK